MSATPRRRPQDLTVLVVEDDPEMLGYLRRLMEQEGFRLESATDGLEVLEKARRSPPAIVLLDLMLPGYGGYELLHELGRGATAAVPLVIVTARFTSPADRAAIGRRPNVAAFFQKPVPPELLVNAVHEILGTKPA